MKTSIDLKGFEGKTCLESAVTINHKLEILLVNSRDNKLKGDFVGTRELKTLLANSKKKKQVNDNLVLEKGGYMEED